MNFSKSLQGSKSTITMRNRKQYSVGESLQYCLVYQTTSKQVDLVISDV